MSFLIDGGPAAKWCLIFLGLISVVLSLVLYAWRAHRWLVFPACLTVYLFGTSAGAIAWVNLRPAPSAERAMVFAIASHDRDAAAAVLDALDGLALAPDTMLARWQSDQATRALLVNVSEQAVEGPASSLAQRCRLMRYLLLPAPDRRVAAAVRLVCENSETPQRITTPRAACKGTLRPGLGIVTLKRGDDASPDCGDRA